MTAIIDSTKSMVKFRDLSPVLNIYDGIFLGSFVIVLFDFFTRRGNGSRNRNVCSEPV